MAEKQKDAEEMEEKPEKTGKSKPKPKYKITAGVPSFKDTRAGVKFVDGVGFTEDASLVPWFRDLGFEVEKA